MAQKKKVVNYEQLKIDLENSQVLVIDVREPSEIEQTGKMEKAIHIKCRNLLLYIYLAKFTVYFSNII